MIKPSKIKVCLLVAAILAGFLCRPCPASNNSGFQYWSRAGFSVDLDKNWTAAFHEEFRLDDGGGNLYYHHTDLGLVYRGLADWLDVGLNYRRVKVQDNSGNWSTEDRPHINVTLKSQLFGLDVSNRSRLEYRDREDKEDLWRYRNRVTFKLPFEVTELRLQPYVADEVFLNFEGHAYDRNRFYVGAYLNLAKNVRGELYYLWQSTKSDGGRDNINAIGTSLKFFF